MPDLNITRNKIDEIDEELIKLFEERMSLVKDVINYKIENEIDILDEDRESIIIEKNRSLLENDEFNKYIDDFTKSLMTISKKMQEDILREKIDEWYLKKNRYLQFSKYT